MQYPNNTQQQQQDINAYEFVGGYLAKEDITGITTVTIESAWSETVEGAEKPKLVVSFEELAKPLILNSTNIRTIVGIAGSAQTSTWVGIKLALYVDPDVVFGGRKVGGIRVGDARVNGHEQRPAQVQQPSYLEAKYNI